MRGNTISLSEHLAFSDRFNQLFRSGMELVEESANYLDGEGREEAKSMNKAAMVVYGTESMRLTTRLMQLASWLLLQRAANEGEMTRDQFLAEKRKISLDTLPVSNVGAEWEELPAAFIALVNRSLSLQSRITAIDAELYHYKAPEIPADNPVDQQINLLSTALGARRKA
jgi:regulator of CtrA degradation